jgi:hypothetical protein
MSILKHEGFPGRREPDNADGRRDDAPAGLFFSQSGHWFHDGDRIFHEGLAGLLNRSVTRADDGTLIVTTGRDRLPFVAEDAPLHIVGCVVADDTAILHTARGDAVALEVVVVGDDHRFRAPIADLWGLMTRGVTQQLAARLDEDDDGVFVAGLSPRVAVRRRQHQWQGHPHLS